jgi:monoamine oxidase
VLEARDRIGGRVHTVHDPEWPVPVELGAEFVHGENAAIFSIVRAARLPIDLLPGDHDRGGRGRIEPLGDVGKRMNGLRRRLRRFAARRDATVGEFLKRGGLTALERRQFRDYVEGYDAADLERVSARWLAGDPDEETVADRRQFRLRHGYGALVAWLRGGLDPGRTTVRLDREAIHLEWSEGRVAVHCTSALGTGFGPYRARAVVVTLPLAVLKARTLRIDPSPRDHAHALERLHGGQAFRIVLRFREDLWNGEEVLRRRRGRSRSHPLHFLHVEGAEVPIFWTAAPARAPVITGWAGGARAERLLAESEPQRIAAALEALASGLGASRRRLEDALEAHRTHDWQADPHSRAAYTYVGVGGEKAPGALGRPVKGTLFFAGEATDDEETGTVGAALASGRRAAREVLRALSDC